MEIRNEYRVLSREPEGKQSVGIILKYILEQGRRE
jgi:hypothetical protein